MTLETTALITGGAQRLGGIIAHKLAKAGWQVIIHYNNSATQAQQVADHIRKQGGTAATVHADLSKSNNLAELITQARQAAGGPLTALINNASIFEYDTVQSIKESALRRHLQLNLETPILLSKYFAAQTDPTTDACIVNLLDQKLWNMNPDFFSYTISKYGLLGATKTLAMALAPKIRVNGVAPGIILPSGDQTQEEFEAVASKYNLLQKPIDPNDVARTTQYLLETPSITGEIISVDNGQKMVSSNNDIMFNTRSTQK